MIIIDFYDLVNNYASQSKMFGKVKRS